MSRGLDLAQTSRNVATTNTSSAEKATMEPLMLSSVQTTTGDITAPANLNSIIIGPITIPTGKNLTVETGGTLTIL